MCRLSSRRLITPLFCLFAALAPYSAVGQVHLGPEAAGANYQVQVMSWVDIPFRSVVRQRYDFSCGSAAVATLLTYHYGRATSEQQTFGEMWKKGDQAIIMRSGFSMFDMKNYLQGIGLHAEGFRMTMEDLAKAKRPAIVLIDMNGFKHFVVVKGVKNDVVLVGDSILGLTKYSTAEFGKMWNGIALAIVAEADASDVDYNLVRDWVPWSQAPVEANSQLASIGDITTHIPPTYQLTPQINLVVRVGTSGE
jgi:predicted double-glycine peptidase